MPVNLDIEFKDYYIEDVYMTADVETGVLYNRAGRRMLALTDDFLIGLHRALENECGERAISVLQSCGRRWGRNFGEGLTAEWSEFYGVSFREFPLALFQSLLVQEFAHNGWGNLSLDYSHYTSGIIDIALQGAVMAAIRPNDKKGMADQLTAGILGGMYSYFLNREVDCTQTQCASQGYPESRFVISSKSRIEKLKSKSFDSHPNAIAILLETTEQ